MIAACTALLGCGSSDNPTTTRSETTAVSTASGSGVPGDATTVADAASYPFPAQGAVLSVVGVEEGDVLYVRAQPDPGAEVVHQFPPVTNDAMVASGENVEHGDQIWARVTVKADGRDGWVNARYTAIQGDTDDVTSELPQNLVADSMPALAELVAKHRSAGPPEPRVTIVDTPSGDLETVTADALGYADDAIAGERLNVFALPSGDQWKVRTVEATTWCIRGVTDDRKCV